MRLREERGLIEQWRAVIARRDGLSALEAVTTHAHHFPDGKLAEDLSGLGERVRARAVASIGGLELRPSGAKPRIDRVHVRAEHLSNLGHGHLLELSEDEVFIAAQHDA